MQSVHRRASRLGERKEWIPQQRSVREHPPAGALRLRVQRLRQRRRQLLVGQRVAFGERLDVHLAHPPFLEIAPGKRHRLVECLRVAPELLQLDVRFTPQRTARLAVRPALAEQRGARDRIALLGQRMQLRALHCGAGRCNAYLCGASRDASVRVASGRNSACRSFRNRRPSGVGLSTAGSGDEQALVASLPRSAAPPSTAACRCVPRNSVVGTPSVSRSAFSMNSNGRSSRATTRTRPAAASPRAT